MRTFTVRPHPNGQPGHYLVTSEPDGGTGRWHTSFSAAVDGARCEASKCLRAQIVVYDREGREVRRLAGREIPDSIAAHCEELQARYGQPRDRSSVQQQIRAAIQRLAASAEGPALLPLLRDQLAADRPRDLPDTQFPERLADPEAHAAFTELLALASDRHELAIWAEIGNVIAP